MKVEEKYLDVLQNIEFGIVSVYRQDTELLDYEVLDAIQALSEIIMCLKLIHKSVQLPYDKSTNTINLPSNIVRELSLLVTNGNKVEAMKRVIQLTGAGLRLSKDYVDSLERNDG